jgi:hypothetical protein
LLALFFQVISSSTNSSGKKIHKRAVGSITDGKYPIIVKPNFELKPAPEIPRKFKIKNVNTLMKTSKHSHEFKPSTPLILSSILLVLLFLTTRASGSIVFFSTGNPDGKIATLSRPALDKTVQTETADDFVLAQNSLISSATFTGLIPLGASLSSIQEIEIEFYHVFPGDSALPPSGNVPTRTNSPADIEIDEATRDSADGSLSFSAEVLSSSFTASNSVITGINKVPNQHTGGEGPVTGQEVRITVTFNPPVVLPADHYFFRPEVLLSSGNFLLLSAPKPIVAPGTPFAADLQSWIRNDFLAPDWLRIGTDITGQGPFNASFSLSGETDADLDGVADSQDQCPGTPPGEIVNAEGCSINQLVPCDGPWKNHGQFVSAIAHVSHEFFKEGLISESQREDIISSAAQSNCGKKAKGGPKH